MLQSGPPSEPSSADFTARVAAAGKTFGDAGVQIVYLMHGTFAGDDLLGWWTEIGRFLPKLGEGLRRLNRRAVSTLLGETGNYTPRFAQRMELLLSEGAQRQIPVRLLDWSGQNTHLGRAEGAVKLIDELARYAEQLPAYRLHGPTRPRALVWAHSHGGNGAALATNLLGGDAITRAEFFQAARPFYRTWLNDRVDLPTWSRVEQVLEQPDHPLKQIALDIVTFGTPIRYGWDSGGYSKLLHIVNHRPREGRSDYLPPYPPRLIRMLSAADGDYMHQIGIAGSGWPPLAPSPRMIAANFRIGRLVSEGVSPVLIKHMARVSRVAEEGSTALVDYDDPARTPLCHLMGHAAYTRTRWLPLHCELIAEEFYKD